MPELIRYLFGDTVERHVSPARYRLEKVAHVTLLGCVGVVAGLSQDLAFTLASMGYYGVGFVLAVRTGSADPTDKLRDLWLCAIPAFVAFGWWWMLAIALVVNMVLIRVQD